MLKKPTPDQRRELGAFLSSCRARLQPATLGLPKGHRRTPGLRREEVAMLSGVSVSWYTWLEQGRDIWASPETLERLAKVLRLNRSETDHLFALSSRRPPRPKPDERLSDGLRQLVDTLDPIPAYIRNARLDILAWNGAISDLFVDYGALPPEERNTLWLLFRHLPYRTLIEEWEQMARGMISVFRAARAKALDKAPFDRLVADLEAESEEFRAWWPETDVQGFDEGSKRLHHPALGHIEFTYVALTPEARPDLSLVTYIPRPAGGESRS